MTDTPRIVEVRRHVLRRNDEEARALRDRFTAAGVFTVSLVSSPGSGKTTLLERTLAALGDTYRTAAIVGDLATENDAQRLAQSGAPVRQITTGTLCHLDASMVRDAVQDWTLDALDLLFVENVGNLVCPASYDLGEHLRAVLISATEGEDKPLKYPTIFAGADVCVLTKMDLAGAVELQHEAVLANVAAVRPGLPVFSVSAKTGAGMSEWLGLLTGRAARLRSR